MPPVNRDRNNIQSSSRESTKSTTNYIRSFECHGVELRLTHGTQAMGDCLFCNKEDKFYVDISDGQWDCKSCGQHGNLITFLRKYWDMLSTASHSYKRLATDRGLLCPDTLSYWGMLTSLTGTWIVPGFNSNGQIVQLYRYVKDPKKNKYRLWATPNAGHGIHWYANGDIDSNKVIIVEGLWNGMILSEILGNDITILAVPGCNVFFNNWCAYTADKEVTLLYDNDHPTSLLIGDSYREKEPAAVCGMKSVVSTLINYNNPPQSIHYLQWGDRGYDPSLKNGYDLRDYLQQGRTLSIRKELWANLSQKIVSVPDDWKVKQSFSTKLTPSKCTCWKELISYWRRAMAWPDSGEGLDYGLSVMLAVVFSTSTQGEQLWVKVIAPPSSGKSVLAEACTVSKRYIKALSTLKGLYSGYRTSKDSSEDNSLVPLILGKTLIIKDGDTLVKSSNFEKILSELRDLYDGAGRSHYNNQMGKDYEGARFTLIICGTEAYMDKFDRSELGERFLDCVLFETIEESLEDDIGWKVALRACDEVSVMVNGVPDSLMTEEMMVAKQKTAGYIDYLRNNALRLISKVYVSEDTLRHCQRIATFVSFMRTKQPLDKGKGHPEVKAQRELSFRLINQFVRLGKCLAAVLGRKEVDRSVTDRLFKVAMDTSRGLSLEVATKLYSLGDNGIQSNSLAVILGQDPGKFRTFLKFLRKIEVVESFHHETSGRRLTNHPRWRLTKRIRKLYKSVMDDYYQE